MLEQLTRQMGIGCIVVCLTMGGFTSSAMAVQFGSFGDAARKAKEAMQKKKDAEAQAKKDAEAKKGTETQPEAKQETESKTETEAKKDTEPQKEASPAAKEETAATPSFQVFSKFDFIPGEKVIVFEDFVQDATGDFPAKWNTDGSGEIVTVAGKPGRWLMITSRGFYTPESVTALPDNFTIEFDVLVAPTFDGDSLIVSVGELPTEGARAWSLGNNYFKFTLWPGRVSGGAGNGESGTEMRQDGTNTAANAKSTPQFSKTKNPVHVSLWRQRQRVRVYWNEEKMWDLPKALSPNAKLNSLVFALHNHSKDSEYYVSNLRVAVGAPDTRNKILSEGKWVTHGILFDVNSDRVKPESYGAMKEIASVLKENPELKVKVVGHTDSDGDDAKNLDLSKRRANSVKVVLIKEFSIEEPRLETDGKGESEPIDKNDTSAGKANNRRVEFVKM
ncbi:MAG: OmpA family protein [Terriglobia bacterium]